MASGSPKRKRDRALPLDTKGPVPRLAFDGNGEEAGDASPRTKAARKFEHLEIDSPPFHLGSERGSMPKADFIGHAKPLAHPAGQRDEATSPDTKSRANAPSNSTSGIPSTERGANSSRSNSPPLSADVSETFWHDSEITGHDPDDPDDDGYGINGIGFRPTAAIAWSRSQRRKQQLSDYKHREARDARQQRSERRKRFISDSDEVPSVESSPRKSIRVHFADG
ncbi:hypothetical protein A1O3_00773 [Capronia epimyces CBS 606.96]|uniref:Uncharacterized protein n=1 Tax=Capronia epimyces CBS 606.96 TaxID=1182542 RepID=W9YI43_9EURO|nr:uncharacterized protein A1O3_00773 [Capronia epimyces CBS 606.96]EXJ92223.1 hypothetical protein A1O3_00773 [Capronia epimyces CBS 606.96]